MNKKEIDAIRQKVIKILDKEWEGLRCSWDTYDFSILFGKECFKAGQKAERTKIDKREKIRCKNGR